MIELSQIDEVKNFLLTSPVLQNKNMQNIFSVQFKQISNSLNDSDVIRNKFYRPLNLVLMGEIKSGKSSLINTIIGQEISPVGVLETTSYFIDIFYANNKIISATINNEKKNIDSFDKLNHILNAASPSDNIYVMIGLPESPLRKLHLIDTPGLMTITKDNEERTKKFIQQSDVVLWIFNANNLGQVDVNEGIKTIAHYGKPIIGVINRFDEVESDSNRLFEYLNRKLGIYLNKIFITSCKNNTGINELLDYLIQEIHNKVEVVHNNSIFNSTKFLINENLLVHNLILNDLNANIENINKHVSQLILKKDMINLKIESAIDDGIENELFQEETQEIIHSMNDGDKKIEEKIQRIINENKIQIWWGKMSEKINLIIQNEWQKVTEELISSYKNDLEELAKLNNSLLNAFYEQHLQNQFSNDIIKTAAISSAFGAGLAAWVAWFGPYSAVIGLGGALAAFVPPLAIAGAITGFVISLFKKEKHKKEMISSFIDKMINFKKEIRNNLHKEVMPLISDKNENIMRVIRDQFLSHILMGLKYEELERLKLYLNSYIDSGKLMIANIEKKALINKL